MCAEEKNAKIKQLFGGLFLYFFCTPAVDIRLSSHVAKGYTTVDVFDKSMSSKRLKFAIEKDLSKLGITYDKIEIND